MGAAPVIAWTAAESPLFVELASRALRARIDGGPTLRHGDSDSFRVEAHHGANEAHLAVYLVGARALIWLEPEVVCGHTWRAGWTLVVQSGSAMHELRVDEPLELAVNEGEVVRATLATTRLALARRLEGATAPVPVRDLAFHRYTRQSSADASTELATPPPWSRPSEAEAAPWWEIDLGPGCYLARLCIRVACGAPGRLSVRAYGLHTREGAPPEGSLLDERGVHAAAQDLCIDLALDDEHRGLVARYVRIELVADDALATLQVLGSEIFGVELFASTLLATAERAYQLFAAQPLLLERDDAGGYLPTLSYAEVWARARWLGAAIGARLAPAPAAERTTAALATRGGAAWIIAELCVLLRGDVSVPISPDEPDERVRAILERTRPAWILIEAADLARFQALAPEAQLIVCGDSAADTSFDALLDEGRALPPLVHSARDEDSLHAVLFTSGSGSEPKGAMRTYAGFRTVIESYALGASPRHLSFQPLSHLSERMFLPAVLAHGGCVAFSRGPAHLWGELRAFEPTGVGSVPRLFEALRGRYARRLHALTQAHPEQTRGELEAGALAETRATFGGRLWAIAIGSAPVSAELLAFVKRVFSDVWVSDGYGTTELGTIAVDGHVVRGVEVELRSADGALVAGEQGEIWVRSPHVIAGYLGADAGSAGGLDDGRGFVATGDLGERDALGRLRVVGRVRNAIKLANGEFVSVDRIDATLASAPLVDRVFVHAEGGAAGVVALVIPERGALAEALGEPDASLEASCTHPRASALVLRALRRHARQSLAAHELPIAVVLRSEPLRVEDGVITASGKWVRARVLDRFGARLRAALDTSAAAPLAAGGRDSTPTADVIDQDLLARVLSISAGVLRREVGARDSLRDLGVESLVAAELIAALSEELGRPVPPTWLLESADLAALSDRLAHFAAEGRVGAGDLVDADLRLTPVVALPSRSGERRTPQHVLLTGATGFLGAHLLETLLARGLRVSALVRAPDDVAAQERLRAASARWGTELQPRAAAFAADLSAEGLSLTPRDRAYLFDSDAGVDCVVHAGARVSWLTDYESLRATNVLGTVALLELAARRGASFHHVSTISTVAPSGDEESTLQLASIRAASTPYALSKWVAEELARRARTTGLAVEIHRPAMIAAHSTRGVCNADDYVHRYIAGVLELGLYIDDEHAKLDMTPVDFVASAISALVVQDPPSGLDETHHYANIDGSLSYAALGRALRAAGVDAHAASHREFVAALRRHPTSRLAPLASFMSSAASLAMGPWPCARTDARLAALGVHKPVIDEAYIARLLPHVRAALG